MYSTNFPALNQDGTCPLFDPPAPAGSDPDSQAQREGEEITAPPLDSMSPSSRRQGQRFKTLFIKACLEAESDTAIQASAVRIAAGLPGKNWLGAAVSDLRRLRLIERAGHAGSHSPLANGREERTWRVRDRAAASAWLEAQGVKIDAPPPPATVAKAEPVKPPEPPAPQATDTAPPSAEGPHDGGGQDADAPREGHAL